MKCLIACLVGVYVIWYYSVIIFAQTTCPTFEEYKNASRCAELCETYALNLTCTDATAALGCYCPANQARHPITGACIPIGCCPSDQDYDYDCVQGKNRDSAHTVTSTL